MNRFRLLTAIIAMSATFQVAAEIKPLNSIALEVNSGVITYADIQRAVNELKSQPANQDVPTEQLTQAAKNHLFERALLSDAARQMGLKVTPAQIDFEIQQRAEQAKITTKQLYQQAAKNGYSEQAYRIEIAKDLLVKQVLADITDNVKVSDAQIKQVYDEAQAKGVALPTGQPYTVYTIRRLILNADGQQNMPAVGERILQMFHAVQQGTSFEALIRRYSQEPQANNGGIHEISDGMLPAIAEEILHHMKPGEITPVIASGTTWQMFQLIDSYTETNPEKMQREAIRRSLLQQERQKAQQQFIGQLQQSAIVREF